MRQHRYPPTDEHVHTMLAESRAQYAIRPTDYLEGVLIALHHTLFRTPYAESRYDEQERNAGTRSAAARAQDFGAGISAAVAWIVGETPVPPVHVVMTVPRGR